MTHTLGRDEGVGAAKLHAFARRPSPQLHEQGKGLLDRVVAMLVKLASALE